MCTYLHIWYCVVKFVNFRGKCVLSQMPWSMMALNDVYVSYAFVDFVLFHFVWQAISIDKMIWFRRKWTSERELQPCSCSYMWNFQPTAISDESINVFEWVCVYVLSIFTHERTFFICKLSKSISIFIFSITLMCHRHTQSCPAWSVLCLPLYYPDFFFGVRESEPHVERGSRKFSRKEPKLHDTLSTN